VAVAMALALPEQVPQRELLQEIAFGVVLFTLIVQGLTVGRVVARWIPVSEGGTLLPTPRSASAE
jgi:CPA1 family monovalent cation:H+ antiporter